MPKNRKVPVPARGGVHMVMLQPDGSTKLVQSEEEYTFAFELRNSARVMVNSAREIEEKPETYWQAKAFVHAAIMLSYASLEAALNEILHIHSLADESPLNEAERNVIYSITQGELVARRNSHTLGKFNMILRIMGKPEIGAGEKIYQNADSVRVLRNMIVHPTPGRVTTFVESEDYDYASQQEIVRKLRGPLRLPRSATFPKDIITKECASWAVSSCEAFLHHFVTISGIDIGFITESKRS